jgi:hypothetical protein
VKNLQTPEEYKEIKQKITALKTYQYSTAISHRVGDTFLNKTFIGQTN